MTKWFTAKRGFALGIVEAGFGVGQMIMVPGSLLLIQVMGWRGTVVVLGLFLLLLVVPVVVFYYEINLLIKIFRRMATSMNKAIP